MEHITGVCLKKVNEATLNLLVQCPGNRTRATWRLAAYARPALVRRILLAGFAAMLDALA